MPTSPIDDDDVLTVKAAARVLGPHAVEGLIESGELEAEIIMPTRTRGYRRFRIQPAAVDQFIERARLHRGDLAHLYPPLEDGDPPR